MTKVRFVWFSRLSREKGAHILRDVLFRLAYSNQELFQQMEFVIFGHGEYEQDFVKLGKQFSNIDFRGWQSFDQIKKVLDTSHYSLLPSLFLETFGLTALESLRHGVPVVTSSKGAQQEFLLDDDCDVDSYSGGSVGQLFDCLIRLTSSFDDSEWKKLSLEAKEKASDYSADLWFQRFLEKSNGAKRVMIVSDYATPLGGIETYLYKVSDLLQFHGVSTEIVGARVGRGMFSKIYRYLLFAVSLFNFPFWLYLQFRIWKYKPDLIFYNSVLRSVGWLGFCVHTKKDCQKWMMYHDLGYVHPLPHRVYNEKQLLGDLDFLSFWKSASDASFFHKFFLFGKWLLLRFLAIVLRKKVNKHLVPSHFMVPHMKRVYGFDEMLVFPHFLR